ncbi:MAG: beta strand repeat-containing protein [Nitrosotalea sp.]
MSKIYHISIILVFAAMVSMIVPAYAIAPLEQFAFQGVLKDNSGNLITGTRNIGLRLYTVYTGHQATNDATCLPPFCLWTENHTSVSVSSGIFTIDAGSINSLTKVINFTNALYLEVIIQGSPDQTLTPRLNITAAPFALAAEKASTDLNLNKKQIINASNIYASGVINGITINNSTQAVSGILSIQVQQGSSVIAGISSGGIINGSQLTIQNAAHTNVAAIAASTGLITTNGGLTIKTVGGSTVGSISNTGVVNGSSIQAQTGPTIEGSISSGGVINGSSLQIESGSSHTNIASIAVSTGLITTNGGLTVKTTGGSTVGSVSNTGVVNGSSLQVENGGIVVGSISNTGTITAPTTSTINGININNGAISGVTTLSTTGAITAPTSTNTINGIVISGGAISGVSTLTTTGIITSGGNFTTNNGIIIAAGHIRSSGTTPSISANCGSVTGTDNMGTFTTSSITNPVTCTITFKSPYASAPICLAGGSNVGCPFTTTTSKTALTIGGDASCGGIGGNTAATAVTVEYMCMGK